MNSKLIKLTVISAIVLGVNSQTFAGSDGYSSETVAQKIGLVPINEKGAMAGDTKEIEAAKIALSENAKKVAKKSSVDDYIKAKKKEIIKKVTQKKKEKETRIEVVNSSEFSVHPGETKIVKVAVGMINTINTPFKNVDVRTANEGEIQVHGGVIDITPISTAPIGLIIQEKGVDATKFSLTLLPAEIPPALLKVHLKANQNIQLQWMAKIQEIEEKKKEEEKKKIWNSPAIDKKASNSYNDKILSLMEKVAKAEIPRGYQVQDVSMIKVCNASNDFPGYKVFIKQKLEGARSNIFIGKVTNDKKKTFELKESQCYSPGVLAVAAYPTPYVKPGQSVELYLIQQKNPPKHEPARKRLIEE